MGSLSDCNWPMVTGDPWTVFRRLRAPSTSETTASTSAVTAPAPGMAASAICKSAEAVVVICAIVPRTGLEGAGGVVGVELITFLLSWPELRP